MLRKAAHVQLINDQIAQLSVRLAHLSPVENILHDACMIVLLTLAAPDTLPGDSARIGVKQDLALIEQKPLLRLIRTVNAICILKFLDIQTEHDHRVDVADLILLRKRQHRIRFILSLMKKKKLRGRAVMCVDCKIYPHRERCRSIAIKGARAHRKTGDFPHRSHRYRIFRRVGVIIYFHLLPPTSSHDNIIPCGASFVKWDILHFAYI